MVFKTDACGRFGGYSQRVSPGSTYVKVLEITQQKPLTHQLAKQQLLMLGKAARAPGGSLLRDSTFCPGLLRSAANRYIRKRGWPRLEWVTEASKMALRMAGTRQKLETAIADERAWKTLVHDYCKNQGQVLF